MKRLARLLIPVVLILIAAPSYAVCSTYCDFACVCQHELGAGTLCKTDGTGCCYDTTECFVGGVDSPTDLVSQYRIASVEVLATGASETQKIRVAEQNQHSQPVPAEIASLKH